MSSSPSTAEARFLESREKRFQERSNRSKHHRPNNDDVVSFWKCTRDMLQQWSDRLHDIIPENDNRTCLTAAQRIRTEAQLDSLLLELQQLRKQCLLVNDESRDFELPLADVRLLHEEFTKHAMKLDTVRQQLCPPTKFVFKRYRAAMRERAENEEVNDVLETQVVTHQHDDRDTARQEKPQQVTHRGNVVEKYSDNTIVVQQDGSIRVQQKGTDEQTTTIISPSNDGEVSSSSSLLLQDLQNCDVTLNGNSSSYKALHLQHLVDCCVRLVVVGSGIIEGAVHVTACRNVQLYLKCHQLRLHDSTDLHCHVFVVAPPVLEDSSGIVFYTLSEEDNSAAIRDAKDFNWLRNGIPSPNFSIVEETRGVGEMENDRSRRPGENHQPLLGSDSSKTDREPSKVPTSASEVLHSTSDEVEIDDEL